MFIIFVFFSPLHFALLNKHEHYLKSNQLGLKMYESLRIIHYNIIIFQILIEQQYQFVSEIHRL